MIYQHVIFELSENQFRWCYIMILIQNNSFNGEKQNRHLNTNFKITETKAQLNQYQKVNGLE